MNNEFGYDRKKFEEYMQAALRRDIAVSTIIKPEHYAFAKYFPMGSTPLFMAREDLKHLISKKIEIAEKRVLDVGIGEGAFMRALAELKADAYGFDYDEIDDKDFILGKTFPRVVEKMKESFYGTFDVALNFRMLDLSKYGESSNFETSTKAVARALVKDGVYAGTLIDSQIRFKAGKIFLNEDGKQIIQTLENNFNKLEISQAIHGPKDRSALFIARGLKF